MEINTKELQKAVRSQIASEVIKSLDNDTKEKIIASGIAEAIGGYKFREAIEKEIINVAKTHLSEYIQKKETQDKIKKQTIEAIDKFTETLNDTILISLMDMISDSRINKIYDNTKFFNIAKKLLKIDQENQ
ncbi:MAG: hypothetical protein ACOC33_00595 [bacterium]